MPLRWPFFGRLAWQFSYEATQKSTAGECARRVGRLHDKQVAGVTFDSKQIFQWIEHLLPK
jgi:hypothetical protein